MRTPATDAQGSHVLVRTPGNDCPTINAPIRAFLDFSLLPDYQRASLPDHGSTLAKEG
jgi:hypothetical protein